MKRLVRVAMLLITAFSITGCISMQEVQHGLNVIDDTWKKRNTSILKSVGTKVYKITKKEAFNAMSMTLTDLGFIVESASYETGLLVLRGPSPAPLTKEEYLIITKGDELEAKEIISEAAGSLVGSSMSLGNFLSDVVLNVHMLERKKDLQISLRMIADSPAAPPGMKFGQQPPPSALKAGAAKIWDAFDRNIFINKKTFN